MTKSRHINRRKFRWTPERLKLLRRLYPDRPTLELEKRLGCSRAVIYSAVTRHGIEKSEAFRASPLSGRLVKGCAERGRHTRFQKGIVPANKGLRRPGWSPGRMRETQFKAGQRGNKYVPIGTELWRDGYLVRKISDSGYPPHDWWPVHYIIWFEAGRKLPPRHVLVFKDRNTKNIVLENIECLSRPDLCRRNSYHNWPKPLAELVQLRGAITRQIHRKEQRERHD